MAKASKICVHCGDEFHLNTSPANIARQVFCSRACVAKALKIIPSFEDRMREKLSSRSSPQSNGCILYTGQNNRVYGQIEYKRKTYLAHRVSYQLAKGEIPKGMCVCHKCDTPLCINPEHLWLGTYSENTRDMLAKGRDNYNPYKKLSDGQMELLRHEISIGLFQRNIAEKFGVSQSYVSMVKNGNRRIK